MSQSRQRRVTESEEAQSTMSQLERDFPMFPQAYEQLKWRLENHCDRLKKKSLGSAGFLHKQAEMVWHGLPTFLFFLCTIRRSYE